MATYNTYNNNKDQNKDNGVTTFSYSMMNPESKIDATRLGFKFWKTFLCVNIAPAEESNGRIDYNPDNGVSVFISHTNAKMLFFVEKLIVVSVKFGLCNRVRKSQKQLLPNHGLFRNSYKVNALP